MSNYLEEFRALVHEGDALNARVADAFEKREQPIEVPIVTDGTDEELNELRDDLLAFNERFRAFSNKYWGAGAPDPNPNPGEAEGMLQYLAGHLEETSDSTAAEWLDEARRRYPRE